MSSPLYSLLFHPLQLTYNRIMVGCTYAIVHLALIGLPMVGAHDVVYAHVESVVVVRYTRTVRRSYITVGEFFSQALTGVGYGRIVEVACKDYALMLMMLNVFSHSVCLWSTFR